MEVITKSPLRCILQEYSSIDKIRHHDHTYRKQLWLRRHRNNTICIEKLPIYDELESVTIILATLYVQKGKRSKIEKSQATNLNFVYANHDMYESYVCCVVEEGWCFFTAQFSDNGYNYMKDDLIITLEGFPTDVNVDIFISGFPHQADVPGCGTYLGRVENGVITIPKPTSSNSGTSYDPFIYFFAVRDKE